MKKNSLALIVFAAAMLTGAFARAECGKVAGYDEKGRTLYYDDCGDAGMTSATNTDLTFNGNNTKVDHLEGGTACVSLPGCATMNASCACTECKDGYTLSNGLCSKSCTKPTGCAMTDSSCNCTVCSSGYTFVDGVCTKSCTKSTGCATMDSTCTSCTKCESGYTLSNGTCTAKPAETVTSCPDGMKKSSDGCCCIPA